LFWRSNGDFEKQVVFQNQCRRQFMAALPSIHALRAIHEPTAQFIIKTGRFEKSNRPLLFRFGVV